jgi:hypothetical protein
MELTSDKYRPYKDALYDEGLEIYATLQQSFSPDFHNRHTIQSWNISSVPAVTIAKWVGATLNDRSLHEITIVNNSNAYKAVNFSASNYVLPDNDDIENTTVNIGPNGTAYFYATASLIDGNLMMTLRRGSLDKRNL